MRLRELRKAQKVTLVELARTAGVDIATISRIETGRMTGTLESHLRLVTALGVKITDLYAGIEEARTKHAATPQLPGHRPDAYVHEAGGSSFVLLTSNVLEKKLLPVLITINPHGHTPQEQTKVGTEKFLFILQGTIEAKVGNAVHQLKYGSSLYLDASVPHLLRNVGKGTAKCLLVVTPPVL